MVQTDAMTLLPGFMNKCCIRLTDRCACVDFTSELVQTVRMQDFVYCKMSGFSNRC